MNVRWRNTHLTCAFGPVAARYRTRCLTVYFAYRTL